MTEQEWNCCTEPLRMLKVIGENRIFDRKLKLFPYACFELESFFSTQQWFKRYENWIEDGVEPGNTEWIYYRNDTIRGETGFEIATRVWNVSQKHSPDDATMHTCRANILRDIFAYPLNQYPVLCMLDSFLTGPEDSYRKTCEKCRYILAWNDGRVLKVAQEIYTEKKFEMCPILADMLEEAGCQATKLLNHLREHTTHVRGCWALDWLLLK